MDGIHVDARGLSCPQPVLKAREAIDREDAVRVTVLVDDEAQAENVMAMARNQGWRAGASELAGGEYEVRLAREDTAAAAGGTVKEPQPDRESSVVVLVGSDRMGEGPDELGSILMRAFIKTLAEAEPLPGALIFINSGVNLTTAGSELLPDLRRLSAAGADILSCGTCLDYFGLKEQLEIGRISNMLEIVTRLAAAGQVIRP